MNNYATIPTLEDLLSNHQLPSNSQSDIINPQLESDPLFLDFLSDYNYEGGSTFQVGSFPIDEQINNNNVEETQNLGLDSMIPFDCSCCQVLREIIHTNDNNNFMKLEIHGKLGVFRHVILNSSTNHQFGKLDFCDKSPEEVKQFLVQYCLKRKQEGYVLVNEPLSIFYEALCVGLQWCDFLLWDAQFSDPSLVNSEPQVPQIDQQNEQPEAQNEAPRDTKTHLALQRQRTKTITLMEISEHFHIPVIQAAEKMNLSETVLKHISRKNNVRRWPYRKVTSIKKKIIKLRTKLESGNEAIRDRALFEIANLRRDAIESCGGVDVFSILQYT
ncbi:hypothetical protein UlMin_004637 [Ulmus minor]